MVKTIQNPGGATLEMTAWKILEILKEIHSMCFDEQVMKKQAGCVSFFVKYGYSAEITGSVKFTPEGVTIECNIVPNEKSRVALENSFIASLQTIFSKPS